MLRFGRLLVSSTRLRTRIASSVSSISSSVSMSSSAASIVYLRGGVMMMFSSRPAAR
jgi:hypothetical protein